MVSRLAICGAKVVLATVFFAAGVSKIWNFSRGISATPAFAESIAHFRLIPSLDLILLLAIYLPWLEIAAALALFSRWFCRGGLLAILFLSGIFFFALLSAHWRGLDIVCGCFGEEKVAPGLAWPIARSLALWLTAAAVYISETQAARKSRILPVP